MPFEPLVSSDEPLVSSDKPLVSCGESLVLSDEPLVPSDERSYDPLEHGIDETEREIIISQLTSQMPLECFLKSSQEPVASNFDEGNYARF